MKLFPRLRQSCRRDRWGSTDFSSGPRVGEGSSSAAAALCGRPSLVGTAGALQDHDSRLLLNRLFLSGVLIADPQRDKDRNGDPTTCLTIAFPAPDAKEPSETALCEIEVPDPVSEQHGKGPQAGDVVFITGQMSGGGGVIATAVHSGPAPD